MLSALLPSEPNLKFSLTIQLTSLAYKNDQFHQKTCELSEGVDATEDERASLIKVCLKQQLNLINDFFRNLSQDTYHLMLTMMWSALPD